MDTEGYSQEFMAADYTIDEDDSIVPDPDTSGHEVARLQGELDAVRRTHEEEIKALQDKHNAELSAWKAKYGEGIRWTLGLAKNFPGPTGPGDTQRAAYPTGSEVPTDNSTPRWYKFINTQLRLASALENTIVKAHDTRIDAKNIPTAAKLQALLARLIEYETGKRVADGDRLESLTEKANQYDEIVNGRDRLVHDVDEVLQQLGYLLRKNKQLQDNHLAPVRKLVKAWGDGHTNLMTLPEDIRRASTHLNTLAGTSIFDTMHEGTDKFVHMHGMHSYYTTHAVMMSKPVADFRKATDERLRATARQIVLLGERNLPAPQQEKIVRDMPFLIVAQLLKDAKFDLHKNLVDVDLDVKDIKQRINAVSVANYLPLPEPAQKAESLSTAPTAPGGDATMAEAPQANVRTGVQPSLSARNDMAASIHTPNVSAQTTRPPNAKVPSAHPLKAPAQPGGSPKLLSSSPAEGGINLSHALFGTHQPPPLSSGLPPNPAHIREKMRAQIRQRQSPNHTPQLPRMTSPGMPSPRTISTTSTPTPNPSGNEQALQK